MKIATLMHRSPITVRKDQELKHARALMRDYDIRHLPVVEEGVLIGVLADRDIAHYTERSGESLWSGGRHLVSAAMKTPVIVVHPEAEVTDAATCMAERRIGCLPVLEDNELVGIVTATDVLAALGQRAN